MENMMAVDVVLLLPEKVLKMALEINQEIIKAGGSKIIFGDDCIPHISLTMGGIKDKDQDLIFLAVRSLAEETPVMNLKLTGIDVGILDTKERVSSFGIKKYESIQSFHEKATKKLKVYFFGNPLTKAMFYNPEEVNDLTLSIVKKYRTELSLKNFYPHITLGIGETSQENYGFDFPINFKVSKIALYQLGNQCTCRKLLTSFSLKEPTKRR